MRNITLLHISDMQFGKFHRFAEGRDGIPNPHDTLTERLIDDLKHLAEHNQVRPDLIICTGDLAEWGMAKEFSDAFAFLAKLCDHYSLPRSRCIVIPGNHDINRKLCSAYFDECEGNGEKPVFPWFPKWKPFKTAFDKFYEGVPGIAFSESEPWSLFILDDLRVVVAGLNSTMDEGHDAAVNGDDRSEKGHHGLCTERQLQWFKQSLADDRFDGWLRIGAVHHNAIRGCRRDDENLRDADLLGGILGEQLHVLLHGHTHEAKADMLAARVRVYSTGSASLKTSSETAPVPTDIPNQYQILRLQRTNINRYCRQYAPRNTPPSFIGDVRQSTTRGDWIIRDPVDLGSVSAFVSEIDVADAEEPTKELGNASTLPVPIPMPPAFYAKPDYIGSHKFVGRNSQLQELTDWANPADPTNLLLFEAIGGNGKSMLTWEWTTNPLHALAARPADKPWAGRFWYSFYEGGASMEGFYHHALAYMAGRPLEDFAKKKPTDLKDELLTMLHARPWLLVLDGLERVLVAYHRFDAAEVPDEEANSPTDKIANRNPCDAIRDEDNDLLRALAAAAPSKLLVSSRLTPRVLLNPSGQPIPGAKRITLPGLRPPDAEALLRSCGIKGKSVAIQSYLAANCDNHPLVIGILGGLIANYLPARGDFDVWAAAPDGGAALDLASLDLVQRRNDILEAAIQKLPDPSRQLLSTLSLIPDSVDYETLKAFNPHLPPEPKEVKKPTLHGKELFYEVDGRLILWDNMSDDQKAGPQKQYEAALARWQDYEKAVQARQASKEFRAAPTKLTETVKDLEQRGLLQWDGRTRKYDLHPVVRGVGSGAMAAADRERHGQRVVDHFTAQPHRPYEEAETLEDVRSGLLVVRTLLRLGRYQQAADAFLLDLAMALQHNLNANAETLALLKPFFPNGWGELPKVVVESDGSCLATCAANSLVYCDEFAAGLAAQGTALRVDLETEDWHNVILVLGNIAICLAAQNRLAQGLRTNSPALEVATLSEVEEYVFVSRLLLFANQSILGQWAEAAATWRLLDPMGRAWRRNVYRPGWAEGYCAKFHFWQGSLQETHLAEAERLAAQGKDRNIIRDLHRLRGDWRLAQGQWALAAESYLEAVRLARDTRSVIDARSETGLALAKHHLDQFANSREEAERLAQLRNPAHRLLAQLWLALGDTKKAKEHALAAFKWAWADGEPYVHRYELTQTTELLRQMNVPIPNLPPYDPAMDEKLPWEDDVRAAIEKLKAEKAAKAKDREAIKDNQD
jgi:3',5'-cyclic AMP phosphodiesterase CpdA